MPRPYNLRARKAADNAANNNDDNVKTDNNKDYINNCKTIIIDLDAQIAQKEAELKAFIEEKSREIGLTQLKEQRKNTDKEMKGKCKHTNSYRYEHISLGYGEFDSRYHCRDCDKRWSE